MSVSALLLLACTGSEPSPPPAVEAPIDPAEWRFATDAERDRYERARADIAAMFAGVTPSPIDRSGNFLRESWQDADREATLAVLHAPRAYPEVFGLIFTSKVERGEVVSTVYWSMEGLSVTGDVFTLTYEAGGDALTISSHVRYEVDPDVFRVEAPASEVAADVAAGPEALRRRGHAQLDAVADQVRGHLDSGAATRCDYPDFPRDGSAPLCHRVPLDGDELTRERARLDAWVGGQRRILDGAAEDVFAAFEAQVPASLR